MSTRMARFPMLLLALIFLAALMLTGFNLSTALPRDQWAAAFAAPDIDNIQQMLFHYSLLPRLAISLLVGAGLGLVGVLFQQVLRNPLAEPTTLGVATGAQLGITITTLWTLPGALTSQFAALAGACVVGALVFGVAWGKRLSPVTLILGAGRQPLLWGDQPAAGAVSPRPAAKHVYVEYRHAHPDRLEYRPAPVAAAVRRRGADAAAAASADVDGPR